MIRNIKKIKLKIDCNMILLCLIVVLTLFRIYLAVKLPLFLQADAKFDDFLLIDYAKNIIEGQWLGKFCSTTLAKGISFPLFIALNHLLGIPYSLGLIILYIFGICLFIVAIRNHIKNKFYLTSTYILLLYSPVMFHIENTQKIYRGGVIVSLSLVVISLMICIYNNVSEKLRKLFIYSFLASLALPFFYYLKEDSMWILPFVLGSIVLSSINIIKNKKIKYRKTRLFFVVMPVVALILSSILYCSINYIYYGEYTITDRNGTYFKEVMADIIKIDEKKEIKDVWITKKMMYKAIDNSKTLKSVKKEIDNMYKGTSWGVTKKGEIEGDIIIWAFRDAIAKAGIYKKGGKKVNLFYKKIDKELDEAFEKGTLKEDTDNKIYLSSIACGFTKDDLLRYYSDTSKEAIMTIVTYNENETSVNVATGPNEDIILMDYLTKSQTVWPYELAKQKRMYKSTVNTINKIVDVYKITGLPIFIIGTLGLITFTIDIIKEIRNKKYESISTWLVLFGMINTCIVLLIGVLWFCSCFNNSIMRHVYNYTCGIIPIIQIIEITGVYFAVKEIYSIINRIKLKKECKK